MKKEQPQSLENQLKMARPKRAEVKRVPLTPEEKEFLGDIMDKAVAAEKAGELQKSLDLYTEYKNELLKIKERLEKEQSLRLQQRNDLIEWAKQHEIARDCESWVDEHFDFEEYPKIIAKKDLDLSSHVNIETIPENIHVKGSMTIQGIIKKMPQTLTVDKNLLIQKANIDTIPALLNISGDLILDDIVFIDNKISDTIFIGGNVYLNKPIHGNVMDLLNKLKGEGKIIGEIIWKN